MCKSKAIAVFGALLPEVPGMCDPIDPDDLPESLGSAYHASLDRAVAGERWEGASLGVRQAEAGETPLSWDEIWHGKVRGLL